ncbi:ribonuclease [Micromonospora sp. NPDC005222]|uniref:ribonuclease n=1 Tax=unclassified Micromonospora TaxID=2617518 RepID=UPI0033B16987
MTDPERFQRQQEGALERGQVFQDSEGRRTRDPGAGAENAESEADRNAEHLARGEVGPGLPED